MILNHYINVNIATESTFRKHKGFDLANFDESNLLTLEIRKIEKTKLLIDIL